MLNVNALQKTLSAMTLPEIQKYAALHKNDPYVVAMALSVANTKKEAQTAVQGMAGLQPMPKVAEQEIAGIAAAQPAPAPVAAPQLPEQQGIGQLPAQNLQGMADGGIVAFDEGGEVEHYQVGGTTGSALGRYQGANVLPRTTGYEGMGMLELIRALGGDVANYLRTSEQEALLKKYPGKLDGLTPTSASLGRSPSNAEIEQQYLGGLAQLPANTPLGSAAVQPGAAAAPVVGAAPAQTGAGLGGLSANSYIERFKKELPAMEKAPTKEDITKEYADIYAPLNTKMQEMLDKERGKIKSDKEEAMFMAMIRGGLAAAGGTSQYGLTNIAKGFEQGAVDYAGSLKDLRQAAKEQSKLEMDFEKAKADQASGNLDRYYKRVDAIEDRNAKIRQLQASSVAGLLGDEMRARATVQAAGAAANAQMNMFRQLGAEPEGSPLRRGFELYKQTGSEPMLYAQYAKLIADNEMGMSGKTKGEEFRRQFPTFEDFMAGFGGGRGGVYQTVPANAPVLRSPGLK